LIDRSVDRLIDTMTERTENRPPYCCLTLSLKGIPANIGIDLIMPKLISYVTAADSLFYWHFREKTCILKQST